MTNTPNTKQSEPIHISVVLDRSGSMGSIADDIVGGFNAFLADQRTESGHARMTLVQFDSDDPFKVLVDAIPVREITDLERLAYQPRGMTPLYDAVGRMIARIDAEIARRHELDLPDEDQVVLLITDGLENASNEMTRESIFELIEARRKRGWVFAFLGANQDTYAAGEEMAVSPPKPTRLDIDTKGTKQMWQGVSHSTTAHRTKTRAERKAEADEFLGLGKRTVEPPP